MKHLTLFKTLSDYNGKKTNIEIPNVSYVEDEHIVKYLHNKKNVKVLYKTDMDVEEYMNEVDYTSFYIFDGMYEIGGDVYYKWKTSGFNKWLLTATDDLSNASLDNPIDPEGYIFNDELTTEYGGGDRIVGVGLVEWVDRDTSALNANNQEYVDLDLPSGRLWATCNVGANSPIEYGKYFAWGDTKGYYDSESHNFDWSTYKYGSNWNALTKYNTESNYGPVDNKLTLDLSDDAAHVAMGGDWMMPTRDDFAELVAYTNNEWVEDFEGSGVNGYLFTSKYNGSTLFIPASGYRWATSVDYQGYYAYLWSSSLDAADPGRAWGLYFNSGDIYPDYGDDRSDGFCVRGVL